jgi:predicted permease
VTFAAAEADVKRLVAGWRDIAPSGHVPEAPRHPLRVDPLKEQIVGSVRSALLMLQGAVAFVLLIACANVANLLIARADARSREYAVRTALGASRLRLFRQLMTEGLVLALAAALAGGGLAWAGLALLLSINADAIPRAAEISLDPAVFGFSLLLAIGTALVFGLVPLAHLAKDRVGQALKDSAGRSSAGSVRTRMRSALVVVEVALAVLLVVGAGLLIRSFVNLMRVDLGFDRAQLTTFSLVLPGTNYNAAQQVAFYDRLTTALQGVPGVQSVALMSGLPPSRQVDANDTDFEHIPNMRPPGTEPVENVDYWQGVSLGFDQALGMQVIEGRAFEPTDVVGAPVVLINETTARRFFTDRSPIGQRLKPGFGDSLPWFTVVGIVKDIKLGGVDADAGTQLYLLNAQLPRVVGFSYGQMSVVVRSTLDTPVLAPSIRRVVADLDAALPILSLRSMDDVVTASVARPRFLTMLLGIFAALALALAAVGTYGILSYLVSERRQEIGIRMALGADQRSVMRMVLGKGLLLSGVGLGLGIAASFGLTRVLRTLLFEVTPTDPLTLAGVTAIIALVAATACLIPAWRATRVNPLTVLRN